jgi:hypothetical protein
MISKQEALIIAVVAVVVTLSTLLTSKYSVVESDYILKNPTEQQLEVVLKGDPAARVWFKDADQISPSLEKVALRTSNSERERGEHFLEELGISYVESK